MFLHYLNVPVLLFALTPFAILLVNIKQAILITLYISIFAIQSWRINVPS